MPCGQAPDGDGASVFKQQQRKLSMLRVGAKEYDTSYFRDVLGLEGEALEEGVDNKLIAEAKELGLVFNAQPPQDNGRPESSRTQLSEAPTRRSESTQSRGSQSTGFASNVSGISSASRQNNRKSESRASLSSRDYDNLLARGRTRPRGSVSSTPSQSVFSMPLSSAESSPKKQYRLMRGLSMLKLHRTDSASSSRGCPHCPQEPLSERRAVHKLPCGHRLCTEALQNTIRSAAASQDGAVPGCCGIPIPSPLVKHVTSQKEQSMLSGKTEHVDLNVGSVMPSSMNESKDATVVKTPETSSLMSSKISHESKVDSIDPETRHDVDAYQERSDFKALQKEQTETERRFLAWTEATREELRTKYEIARETTKAQQEIALEALEEQHEQATSEAEDKQVKAESDMREIHAKEEVDSATAQKYMEAYCSGTFCSGEPHGRTVTEQDHAELEKARRARGRMAAKHASAINVLRGEQAWRMRLRGQRQEKAVQELRQQQRKDELEAGRACTVALHAFDHVVSEKRLKLRARWDLEMAIFAKKVDSENGVTVKIDPRPNG